MNKMEIQKIKGALWGSIVGDALGVPHEFKMREELEESPVVSMEEYGTHNQPKGTWSDDSSLILCSLISLSKNGLDFTKLMELFVDWLENSFCTPHGEVFDIGDSTMEAILTFRRGGEALFCGGDQVWQNGNGSLMRMLPVSIFLKDFSSEHVIEKSLECSSLTHRHSRSQVSCGFYSILVKYLLKGLAFEKAYDRTLGIIKSHIPVNEMKEFSRVLDKSILNGERISSTGYVIHSLEASLYCISSTKSFKGAVLKAVNLGFDTDTTAAITGSLAGIIYGYAEIPEDWLRVIVRREFIENTIDQFILSL
ncbi:MAG: ADP-ribosylglycohydrolase family protein [Lentisphaeraceae bacterium]|nr:ADP-ribosylglycohydrolase family protein [Lentisphaeraceae bacterium]